MTMAGLDTTAYDELQKKYNASVDSNTASQIANAQQTAQSNLKQAYVSRLQNEQKMNKNLATAGIRGGMSETANLGVANNYANQRGTINSQLASNVRDINNTANQNKLAYAQEIDTAKQSAIENYDAEQRAYAREDALTAYNRQQENLTARYSKYYSAKDLKKALANATTALEKQVINARLGYLAQHKHKY